MTLNHLHTGELPKQVPPWWASKRRAREPQAVPGWGKMCQPASFLNPSSGDFLWCETTRGRESCVGPSGVIPEDVSSLGHMLVIQQITWTPRKRGSCPHCLTWAGSLVSSGPFASLCQAPNKRGLER